MARRILGNPRTREGVLDAQQAPMRKARQIERAQVALGAATAAAAQFDAMTTAREIVLSPATTMLADALLRSGGFRPDPDIPGDTAQPDPVVPLPPGSLPPTARPSPHSSGLEAAPDRGETP